MWTACLALHAKNDVNNALHVTEPLRVEVIGNLDVFMVCPGDLEGKACGCELNKPQAEVARVGIVIVGLDVADAAIIVLKLTLNEKMGMTWPRQIEVIVAGGLAIEGDLEVLVAGFSYRHVISVKSHGAQPCFSAYQLIPSELRLPEGSRGGNGLRAYCEALPELPIEPSSRRGAFRLLKKLT